MRLARPPSTWNWLRRARGWSLRNCPAEVLRAAADGEDGEDGGETRYRADLAPSLVDQGLFGLPRDPEPPAQAARPPRTRGRAGESRRQIPARSCCCG